MRSELASREAECWEGLLLGYVVGGGRAEAPRWGRQILGCFCDWCGRVVMRTPEAVEENRGSFFRSRVQRGTGRIFFLTKA